MKQYSNKLVNTIAQELVAQFGGAYEDSLRQNFNEYDGDAFALDAIKNIQLNNGQVFYPSIDKLNIKGLKIENNKVIVSASNSSIFDILLKDDIVCVPSQNYGN